jgi:type II secretory pathway pseudopilin PulG
MRYLHQGLVATLVFLTVSAGAIQNPARSGAPGQATNALERGSGTERPGATKAGEPDLKWLQEILADRELMQEIGGLAEKLQKGVHYPAARNESRILPRLPESTVFYGAYPNYGETMHQALRILEQELKQSPHLRDFLEKHKLDAMEPKVEDFLEKFYELSQFLGDEVVIEGQLQGSEPSGVIVAEIKKPGLRVFLEKLNNEWITNKADRLLILGPEQLAATDGAAAHKPAVLIRPDLVAISFDVASLQAFNSNLDQANPKFISGRLGQRLAQAYQGGANSVLGVDLHKVISSMPRGKPQDRMMLEKTGLGDVEYLVMQNTMSAKGSSNEVEVIFNGPRHGIASWIGAPAPMGGLDFVSARTASAGDLILKNPAQIFDELRDILGESGFTGIRQLEMQLNLSLKYDLLSKLGGEIAFETKAPPMPATGSVQATFDQSSPVLAPRPGALKLILRVSDAVGLQQTLTQLLAKAPVQAGQREEDGVMFHTLVLPAQTDPPTEINYFFVDGYMVIASDRATAREALEVHRNGHSLAKSSALRESLAQAQSGNASAVFYQDPSQTWGAMMAQLPPEMRSLIPANAGIMAKPTVLSIQAEESSFRAFTNSSVPADASVALIVAAVAIPSLMRSRSTANEAVAASVIRTVNTAQDKYSVAHPAKGYAPNLAVLGPGGGDCSGDTSTPEHACLLDEALANGSCTSGKWCEKSGYKFSIRGVCLQAQCPNYVVTAIPATPGAGAKSYCSTSDGLVRANVGAAPDSPLTVSECKKWAPVR